MNALTKLWTEHQAAKFPSGLGGTEIEGIDLALLDADVAGCIVTSLAIGGRLDALQQNTLRKCRRDALKVIPKLRGDVRTYFERLERITSIALG